MFIDEDLRSASPPAAPLSVMLATDGSEHALRAARFLARMLDPQTARVQVHTVLSATLEGGSYFGDLSDSPARRAAAQAAAEDAVRGSRRILEEAGLATHTSHSFGNPPDELLTEADARRVDLLVVGRRGLRMPAAIILGSVSSYLLHHASLPVLIVP